MIRSISRADAEEAVREALRASSPAEATEALTRHAGDWIELTRFMASWRLSASA